MGVGDGVGLGVAVGDGLGVGVGDESPQARSVKPTATQASLVEARCWEETPNRKSAAASLAARALQNVGADGRPVKARKKMSSASARPMPLTFTLLSWVSPSLQCAES